MKVAFYAPMKSPDHPVPSGDRRVARLLMKALEGAGFEVELISEFRSFDKTGNNARQDQLEEEGAAEAHRILVALNRRPKNERPTFWFTYHVYHKAPDWLGPFIAKALDIPYLIAEASHAPKQKEGRWARGYAGAQKAISSADKVFHMTRLDGECLRQIAAGPGQLTYLPPFLDEKPKQPPLRVIEEKIAGAGGKMNKVTLLTVAMMRSGDKLQSYIQLAEALGYLKGDDWQLLIVGDGDQRPYIENLFKPFEDKVHYLGELDGGVIFGLYERADIYVWPAHGEAYGMTFLEAASCGLPSVAGNIRGVPDVVLQGKTGLLSPAGDLRAFSEEIQNLIEDGAWRHQLGQAAKAFVKQDRNLDTAAQLLKTEIEGILP